MAQLLDNHKTSDDLTTQGVTTYAIIMLEMYLFIYLLGWGWG